MVAAIYESFFVYCVADKCEQKESRAVRAPVSRARREQRVLKSRSRTVGGGRSVDATDVLNAHTVLCTTMRGMSRDRQGRVVDRTPTIRRLLDQRTLIDELWRLSHFGWIPEASIRRALTLAGGHEIPSDSLHQGLHKLLERGCVDHRDSDADTGEYHWRLTDSGRHTRFS